MLKTQEVLNKCLLLTENPGPCGPYRSSHFTDLGYRIQDHVLSLCNYLRCISSSNPSCIFLRRLCSPSWGLTSCDVKILIKSFHSLSWHCFLGPIFARESCLWLVGFSTKAAQHLFRCLFCAKPCLLSPSSTPYPQDFHSLKMLVLSLKEQRPLWTPLPHHPFLHTGTHHYLLTFCLKMKTCLFWFLRLSSSVMHSVLILSSWWNISLPIISSISSIAISRSAPSPDLLHAEAFPSLPNQNQPTNQHTLSLALFLCPATVLSPPSPRTSLPTSLPHHHSFFTLCNLSSVSSFWKLFLQTTLVIFWFF